MNIKLIYSISVLLIILQACNKDSKTGIRLPDNQSLSQITAGKWINSVIPSKVDKKKDLVWVIHDHLKETAELVDIYKNKDKKYVTRVWKVYYSYDFERDHLEDLFIEDTIYYSEEGSEIRITLKYPPPGILWQEIVPEYYKQLKSDRNNELAMVIDSPKDKARLFLYGSGFWCTQISLF